MSRNWLIATRVLLLIALGTSAVLYSYYIDPLDSQFCAAQSGCETLRRSPLAYFGSQYVSLPLFGMLAFALALGVSLWAATRAAAERFAPLLWMLGLGAVSAVFLLAYQAWVAQAFCWLCVLTDTTATLAAVAAYSLHRTSISSSETQRPGLAHWAWVALATMAVTAPLVWNAVRPLPPVPDAIRALYLPGKINVVEFADLQCPHCRKLQPLLKSVIASYPGQVNFVRKHAPLPQHAFAEAASRAVICADVFAKRGEEMVDRLTASDLDERAPFVAADALGLDAQQFNSCLADDSTKARIDQDLELLQSVGFEGLPTTYVGAQRFVGVRNEEAWRDAFERAARGEGNSGIPGSLFMVLVLLLVAALVAKGRAPAQ